MKKTAVLIYGVVAYLCFFATFLYLIGFMGNIVVPRTVDVGLPPIGQPAVFINLGLIFLFGLQHSVMARPGFKKHLTKIIPEAAERSTFVLFTCVALSIIFCQWRPIPKVMWDFSGGIPGALLWTGFGLGWAVVFLSTWLISHFDLFGLRQVWLYYDEQPYTHIKFKKIFFYKWIRHPLMLGFLLTLWSIPTMTMGHLLFSCGMSVCIFVGLHFEERDLLTMHGDDYARYQESTSMILPFPKK